MAEQGRVGAIFKVVRDIGALVQKGTELAASVTTGLGPLLAEAEKVKRQVEALVQTLQGAREASFSQAKPEPEIPIVEVSPEAKAPQSPFPGPASDLGGQSGGSVVGAAIDGP